MKILISHSHKLRHAILSTPASVHTNRCYLYTGWLFISRCLAERADRRHAVAAEAAALLRPLDVVERAEAQGPRGPSEGRDSILPAGGTVTAGSPAVPSTAAGSPANHDLEVREEPPGASRPGSSPNLGGTGGREASPVEAERQQVVVITPEIGSSRNA